MSMKVLPVIQPYRRIPFPMRRQVEKELDRLERTDIREKVYGPTEWVSPIVLQTKRNTSEIRLCADMRLPNKAIKRTRHVIPTIEEVRHALNGAICFSKIDLKNAYHQLELHPDSRDITTFVTHKGLRRKRDLITANAQLLRCFMRKLEKTSPILAA